MAQKEENIDPSTIEGLEQRRKEYAELTEELHLLALNYESAAAGVNMSPRYFRNMSAKEGKPTAKAIALLRRYIDIQKKVHLHFRNKLPNPGNILNEDPAAYSIIKKQLDSIEKKVDRTSSIADLLIENQANGNESLKRSIEETVIGTRGPRVAKRERAEKTKKKKGSPAKPSSEKPKDATTPPSNEGNNEPA